LMSQGIVGDQLSIERGINHLLQVANVSILKKEKKDSTWR
jgi:hypothetical protein